MVMFNINKYSAVVYLIISLSLIVSGCSTATKQARKARETTDLRITATPKATPQRTITNFSNSLKCMDDLFTRYNIANLIMGAQDIPDHTEIVTAGTKDMLISALSQMSVKSNAIRFVALGADLEDIRHFHALHKNRKFTSPDFFIRGAITQADQGVEENLIGGGIALARKFSVEGSKDKIASIIALDMNAGLVSNLQIIPGVTASNSIAVVREGKGLDASATIDTKWGVLFHIDDTKNEGLHHAVRTLVELGTIELVGKLTQVPYWECLDIETTNTFVQAQLQDWYQGLNRPELVKFTKAKLKAIGHFDGEVNETENERFRTAVALFKSDYNLTANSELDFLLYYTLIADQTPIDSAYMPLLTRTLDVAVAQKVGSSGGPREAARPTKKESQHLTLEKKALKPLALTLNANRKDRPVYRVGETAEFSIETSIDAHVYCYYQPTSQEIVKVYPNRFRADSLIQGGVVRIVPGGNEFAIQFDRQGKFERFMCMASYKEIDNRLIFELREKSLQPVSLAKLSRVYKRNVASLNDIYEIYKSAAEVVPLQKTITLEIQ